MEQRDLIKDQIEQLGRVLGHLLTGFRKLRDAGKPEQAIEVSNEQFHELLDKDVSGFVDMDYEEVKALVKKKQFNDEHLELLSSYLEELAHTVASNDSNRAFEYVEQAIQLLELADEISASASFTRISKMNYLVSLKQQLHKG
ncbi:MAG: hypothetical protein JJ975_03105 [Bacteroidia bacterium]|nr:hypothetical protein [Bacteroidia bacterium]